MRDGIAKKGSEIIPLFPIGMGGQSVVYLSYDANRANLIALKIAKTQNHQEIFERETEILGLFKHKNIVRVSTPVLVSTLDGRYMKNKGFDQKENLYFAMELSHLGSLYEYVLGSEGGMSMCFARFYALQMIDALEQVHKLGFVHRDFKLENLLLFEKGALLKLSDFGCCLPNFNKKEPKQEAIFAGTDFYIAPEVNRHEGFSEKSDLFSLGVCLYILAFGCLPFSRATASDKTYRLIASGNKKEFSELLQSRTQKEIPSEFLELLLSLWSFSPENRPGLEEVRQSKWFAGDICDAEEAILMVNSMKNKVRHNYVRNLERMKHKKVSTELDEKLRDGLNEITKIC